MNHEDANVLLTQIALGDNRTTDDAVVDHWRRLLHDIRIEDALEAVATHRRESTEYLQPAHIVRLVRALRQRRVGAANIIYEPIDAETGRQFLDRVHALTRAAGDGHLTTRPIHLALAAAGPAPVPPPEIEASIQASRTARAALANRCPWCAAAAGQPCTIARGRAPRGFVHPSRTAVPSTVATS